ncbi:MAG: hypothetical protein HUK02_06570 [Bacteroidaceae bacterium]|nr:hypothetical protein [Bacteroidaceae bacterium]
MDWNFKQGHKFNPFAGLGVGLAHHHIKDAKLKDELKEYVHDVKYFKNDGVNSVIFSPRLGVELFRHCRLTATVRISKKYFNSLQLTAGATFGGRPKK